MEWEIKIPEMELLSIIHGHGLVAAFIFLLVNLSPSSSLPQGMIFGYNGIFSIRNQNTDSNSLNDVLPSL